MAATLQQHCTPTTNPTTNGRTSNTAAVSSPNPQLKRLVYSKYRELLGSYNDQANAYIETLPSYMVHKDTGFNLELKNPTTKLFENGISKINQTNLNNDDNEMYGSGQRMPAQQTYEAPACVQNAMMTKDKKPFTYTPGGIDLSQIKSERMAKRLARNAQAEGATGQQQQNRPTVANQSPGSASPNATAAMGAAALGMPFQVLPPPPPPAPGKNLNGGSAPAPPPPPPSSSSNFSNTGTTLAPPTSNDSGGAGGRGSAPNSPNMPRKSPTPQRFEPPPMGFRPEIKIPPNPMAALRKVPPPVEKNTFWKDEYVKERSKSPMVESSNNNNNNNNNSSSNNNNNNNSNVIEQNDSVNSTSSSPQTTNANNTNGTANLNSNNNDNIDGFKKTMPTTTTNNNNNVLQQNQTNNNYTNYQQSQEQQLPQQQQQQQQIYTPPTPPQTQLQQSPIKSLQQSPQYGGTPPAPLTPPQQQQQQQQQQSPKPEFRSVAAPTSPAVNVYTRQSDSPRSLENATPPRATDSPFRFAQQQQQQQRAPPAVSPLAQQFSPSSVSTGVSVSPNNQAQSVPWRTQRSQPSAQPQQQPVVAQSHPQPIYNNVQQQQQQRIPDFSTQQSPYQGPKPTNVGSLYIAPLAPPTEPQAQHIVRQQLQQQQQQRDSPMRQMATQQPSGAPTQQLRWMSSQPVAKEQPAWARPEENGNVVPSSLNRFKSPPPPPTAQQQQPGNNGFMPQSAPQNFGAQPMNTTGLRLQINTPATNQINNQNGPKERIIPIQLEQTPTYTPAQPSFTPQQQQYGAAPAAPGYVMRTPNQFVDQGYNNFGQQQQQQPPQAQRVMSPTLQQLNAPRMVQQTQNNVGTGNKTHIIPIALENNDGTRGPISKTPIVIQNDQRTPPVQSKSFRILQKITDTIDDGSTNDDQQQQQQQQQPIEPQLHRPTFARQMSAQQARHSPTVEQMRRMQIGHEQGNFSTPTTPNAIKYNQQRSFNDNSPQHYIPPSEQQAPEPKKYTGSAIPSRSFKILQAMTQPENADEQENSQNNNNKNNNNNNSINNINNNNDEMNEIDSKPENNRYSYASNDSTVEPVTTSCSSSSINSELAFSSSPSPTPPPTQPITYPPYPYPYGYPWYPPPPPPPPPSTSHLTQQQNGENFSTANWPYPYVPIHAATPPPPSGVNNEQTTHPTPYAPYPYYYPYPYPIPPPPHQMSPFSSAQNSNSSVNQAEEYDLPNMFAPYLPPPPPYIAYPYPVAPSYSQSSNSSRASSMLPDIIITPSTDDLPSQVILQHHIKVDKEARKNRAGSIEIEDVSSLKSNPPSSNANGSVVDVLTKQLENISKTMENNLNNTQQTKKSYKKNIQQKSPEENTSPVQISMIREESEIDSGSECSDSETTPKQMEKKAPIPLKSIKSVNNVQIYKQQNLNTDQEREYNTTESESETQSELEEEEDNETTADGESDIFDEEEDEPEPQQHNYEMHKEEEEDSDVSEEFIMDDNLSVIYEEESEMEKSSDMAKTVIRGDRSSQSGDLSLDKDVSPDYLEHKIEENDDEEDEEEEKEDSTSVTVRLPLKLSFSSSKDAENIATIEVGNSQIEEKRNSLTTTTTTEKRNFFNVATIKSDSEEEEEEKEEEHDNDCDVSVTISLSNSSKSNSWAEKNDKESNSKSFTISQETENATAKQTLIPEIIEHNETNEEEEDVSVSFSLNMRNKFAKETLNDGITNNIAVTEEADEVKKPEEAPEEMDFFATLMATKMQAQKIKEQSANYWGKAKENKDKKEEDNKEENTKNENIKEENNKEETGKENSKEKKEQTKEHVLDIESKEAKINFWNQYSAKAKTETKATTKVEATSIHSESQDIESKESKINFWNKYSAKSQTEATTTTKTEDNKTKSTSNKPETQEQKEEYTTAKPQEEIKKPKFSFWDRCSTLKKEEKVVIQKPKETLEPSFWDRYSMSTQKQEDKPLTSHEPQEEKSQSEETKSDEIEDIWADRVEDLPPIKPIKAKLKPLESAKESFWSTVSEATKATLEPQIESEMGVETKVQKPLPKAEFINRVEFKVKIHTFSFMEPQVKAQNATVHYEVEEEEKEEPFNEVSQQQEIEEEEAEEVDFWAQIEKSRENKDPEPMIFVKEPKYYQTLEEQDAAVSETSYSPQEQHTPVPESYSSAEEQQTPVQETSYPWQEQQTSAPETSYNWKQQQTCVPETFYNLEEQQTPVPESSYSWDNNNVQEPTYINSFGEQELSMYNDDCPQTTAPTFDPFKYPEEPREVDTDEEIDFWAEIEAKKQNQNEDDDDDVTFHKSASFWASRERQKSVDETPYKPVLPKPFPAKLPDEPPVENIDIWQTLEAHKGEEPIIIDPQVEEEKALAQEYDKMAENEMQKEQAEDENDDAFSVHEPVVASVWCPPAQNNQYQEVSQMQQEPETEIDFWAQIEQQKEKEEERQQDVKDDTERGELEVKRNNYRKAMAFFTTSIDENKDQSAERYEPKKLNSKRSSRIEEENETWDWDAVNEALQEEKKEENSDKTPEAVETPVNETFDKEQTPQFATPLAKKEKEKTPLPEVYKEPKIKRLPNGLPDLGVNKFYEERKVSVKSRISAFESGAIEQPAAETKRPEPIKTQSLSVERPGSLSRNSSTQRSESEMDEDDSGVTDMNKQLSETDTESESFPELRKMSSYQRAATHSRLFKLLQDDPDTVDAAQNGDEFQFKPSRRKIVHNVSITRKQNPQALAEAETMSQRRERLSLPLRKNTSIDADNPSTPNSPASPIMGHTANKSSVVSDKLVSELVQSLLLRSDSTHFRNLPMEKLQAAAKRVLEEELDSLENTSVDSTPAMTPNEIKKDKSYADYYSTWSDAQGKEEIVPSKSFRALQETRRTPWTARCPRVLGSKTINRDLARVTESPEISMRSSKSPECFRQSRESSIGKWKKS
ncbi:uncharacterized protein ACRADG_004679 isoform 2-T2 [Cochliomyia hominivorax]